MAKFLGRDCMGAFGCEGDVAPMTRIAHLSHRIAEAGFAIESECFDLESIGKLKKVAD